MTPFPALYIQESIQTKNCWYIWPGAAQSSFSSLDRDKRHLCRLIGLAYFPPYSPYHTDATLQVYDYSITASIANVQMISNLSYDQFRPLPQGLNMAEGVPDSFYHAFLFTRFRSDQNIQCFVHNVESLTSFLQSICQQEDLSRQPFPGNYYFAEQTHIWMFS